MKPWRGRVPTPALDAWRTELARGERTRTTFDPLFRARERRHVPSRSRTSPRHSMTMTTTISRFEHIGTAMPVEGGGVTNG